MINYNFGDIVLVVFPFSGGNDKKQRPALVILDVGDDDFVLAPITTRKRRGIGDIAIEEWADAGLLTTSWVRLAKVACLEKQDITRKLGFVSVWDGRRIKETWQNVYNLK